LCLYSRKIKTTAQLAVDVWLTIVVEIRHSAVWAFKILVRNEAAQTSIIYWKADVAVIATTTSLIDEGLQLAKSRRAFAFVANDRQGREVARLPWQRWRCAALCGLMRNSKSRKSVSENLFQLH
jgi:hypothetical protein